MHDESFAVRYDFFYSTRFCVVSWNVSLFFLAEKFSLFFCLLLLTHTYINTWEQIRLSMNMHWTKFMCVKNVVCYLLAMRGNGYTACICMRNDQSTSYGKIDFCANWSQFGWSFSFIIGGSFFFFKLASAFSHRKITENEKCNCNSDLAYFREPSHRSMLLLLLLWLCASVWVGVLSCVYASAVISIMLRHSQRAHIN